MAKRIDPLTKWIDANCGTSDPVDYEPAVKQTAKETASKTAKDTATVYAEALRDFHNGFVGE
jgi:hypothetical protein